MQNLFDDLHARHPDEQVDVLLEAPGLRLERIVSIAHVTPAEVWLDQDADEWVALLSGSAWLRFEDEPAPREMQPGSFVLIPAHRRHRVERTDAREPTVWLALHYSAGGPRWPPDPQTLGAPRRSRGTPRPRSP